MNPPTHTLLFGEPGSGKSTAAATWPTPMLVFLWDPYGKDQPYLDQGSATPIQVAGAPPDAIPWRDVLSVEEGQLLIRLEYFHDEVPSAPSAYPRFLRRMVEFAANREARDWATVVVDSITFMELAARKYAQYTLNPHSREPRQWYGHATEALEEILMIQLGALPTNVVVMAHVDKDKDEVHGEIMRNPSAPGRLRYRLAAAYGELYYCYVTRDDHGHRVYGFQTQSDGRFHAASRIKAPNPCAPTYAALWEPV